MNGVSLHPKTSEKFIDRLATGAEEVIVKEAGETPAPRNLERIQTTFRAIAQGDFNAVAALLDEDVEMELIGSDKIPVGGRWRGREEVKEASRSNFATVADQHADLLAMAEHGDDVVVFCRERGRVRATGALYDILWSQHFTFENGLIKRIRGVYAPMRTVKPAGPRG